MHTPPLYVRYDDSCLPPPCARSCVICRCFPLCRYVTLACYALRGATSFQKHRLFFMYVDFMRREFGLFELTARVSPGAFLDPRRALANVCTSSARTRRASRRLTRQRMWCDTSSPASPLPAAAKKSVASAKRQVGHPTTVAARLRGTTIVARLLGTTSARRRRRDTMTGGTMTGGTTTAARRRRDTMTGGTTTAARRSRATRTAPRLAVRHRWDR